MRRRQIRGCGAAHVAGPVGEGCLQTMMLRLLLGVVVGGGLGFALYKVVGCSSGACPLTSNPIISVIYGSILGALFASSLR
jgi:hypothetical protein